MEKVKKLCNRIFIDGLSGMAQGLFATLLVGTILEQVGNLIGGTIGAYIIVVATVAKSSPARESASVSPANSRSRLL